MSAPEIAVVVPTHERAGLLGGLLRALAAQTAAPSSYEVAIVCDGCTDGSAAAARALAGPGAPAAALRTSVIEQPRSGAATARNRGVAATTAPILLFLDDDMVPEPGCLAAHAAAHRARPDALVLGAIPVHPDSPRSFLTEGLARWARRRDQRLSQPGAVPVFTDVLTGHLSIARRRFEALGGFDPSFTQGGTFGGEDIEFGWRACAAGVPIVYAPAAVAAQVYVKSFRSLARDIADGARADAALGRKHPEAAPFVLPAAAAAGGSRERAAMAFARRAPGLASALAAPLVAALDAAARRGATGGGWEALHACARALLAGVALSAAGR